jgi:hypothetical protein
MKTFLFLLLCMGVMAPENYPPQTPHGANGPSELGQK